MNKRTTKVSKVKDSRPRKSNSLRTPRSNSPRTPAHKPQEAAAQAAWRQTWPKIVARAWADEAFLARLTQHPEAVAEEYKLPMLDGVHYKVVSGNEPPTLVLSLPPKPADLKMESMEELADHAEQAACYHSSCL
jgi:hypothetical protein